MEVLQLDHAAVLNYLPDRKLTAHKGDFGKILLLCGSRGYTGAAALAAMGALRSGAGLVYLGVPECIYDITASRLLEPVVLPLPDCDGKLAHEALPGILKMLPEMDAVLMGPGLGRSEGVLSVVSNVLEQYSGPVIIDADGINALSRHKDIVRGRTAPTILTPHAGEFKRLTDKITSDRIRDAANLALDLGAVVLLKGHNTVITDGVICYLNPTGNPGMAVGGSGDLLSGMIVSLIGQGISPVIATACAAWLHGRAGDVCAQQMGQYGMLPSDMLQVLPRLMK